MIKIQLDPNAKNHLIASIKKIFAYSRQLMAWLWRKAKQYKPTRKTVFKGSAVVLLLGAATGAAANYAPKWAGQSNLTAVQAAQTAFGVTNGGIITEAEFDIGKQGSHYEFEIISGGKKYDVNVDAMSGQAQIEPYHEHEYKHEHHSKN